MAKILIIDDDRAVRELLAHFLTSKGYDVAFAEDGCKGVDAVRDEAPDLVFLDIQMPCMDGVTAVKTLKNDAVLKSVPVIALSSHKDPMLRDDMHQAGADVYLTKPFDFPLILKHVENLL